MAVFVGGTSGIGETTLKQFAKQAVRPVCYIVGRSREAAEKIIAECKTSNPDGQYIFIKGDVSLMSGVDRVCEEIMNKESVINLLFLTPMVPDFNRSGMFITV